MYVDYSFTTHEHFTMKYKLQGNGMCSRASEGVDHEQHQSAAGSAISRAWGVQHGKGWVGLD